MAGGSYKVSSGPLLGRIGSNLGQGLSEQLPKEVSRNRLSAGLRQFEQEAANLTPLQQLSRLASIPGALEHPQLIQSFGNLAQQQQRGQALADLTRQQNQPAAPQLSPFPTTKPNEGQPPPAPSITTPQPIEETVINYIPKTYDEILQDAGKRYNENPALYSNDPNKAIEAATFAEQQRKDINEAYQQRRTNEQKVQDNVTESLRNQASNLGVEVPPDVYSSVEDEAIQAVKPKSQGGRGLTEQQAKKEYAKKLDAISRDYKEMETIGKARLITKTPEGNKSALKSLRESFEKRNDLENFAKSLTSQNGLTPSKAYYLAYPIERNKNLNNALAKLSDFDKLANLKKKSNEVVPMYQHLENESRRVSNQMIDLMDGDTSPLAVAEVLKSKGYDPKIFMDMLDKNKKVKERLTAAHERELNKNRDFTPSINDLWMFYFSGLDKFVEQ